MKERWTTAARKKRLMKLSDGQVVEIGLSPLAGVSDLAFRSLCVEKGADFAVTEMVSAKALYYDNRKTRELMKLADNEKRTSLQLFGSEPKIFAQVIREELNGIEGFATIDLNLGCPAPKIVNNNEGSALMKDPLLFAEIVRSMVKASRIPISVKFRLGFDDDHINFLEIGRIAQEEGASFVTLHARTREQMYSGRARWEAIGQLKAALSIPVIGNGDVTTPEEAKQMLDLTSCDGIAIGRGAQGNPFIFKQVKDYLQSGTYHEVTPKERLAMMIRHFDFTVEEKGERIGLLEMRKHLGWYLDYFANRSNLKRRVNAAETIKEVKAIIEELAKQIA